MASPVRNDDRSGVGVTSRGSDITPRLVAEAREGAEGALERLVEAAYPRVRRWAVVQVGNDADADDLTQDVLIKMIRSLDSYQGEAAFGTWLYAMTRNAALDAHRRAARERRRVSDVRAAVSLTPDAPPSPDRGVQRHEARAALEAAFVRLPLRQREAFDLVELQGLTSVEAAELLGIEPVSVRAHLFKARRSLRKLLLAPGGAVPDAAPGEGGSS
jgi:RNA polymerase sigma-70 factor (ECF subfamily)